MLIYGEVKHILDIGKMNLPFDEIKISENIYIRTFSPQTSDYEFKWHRDAEDRKIKNLEDNDWMLQIDNSIPIKIDGEIFIPKGVYHRLIKGTTNLSIQVVKINE